jgi:drug/metabolite transporter (DMT)-like permease
VTHVDMTTSRSDRPTTRPSPPILVAAFVVLVILVGANIVAIRFSNRELAPFWNAGLRFALATVAFAAIGFIRGSSRPNRRALRDGVAYGLLAFAAFFGFVY